MSSIYKVIFWDGKTGLYKTHFFGESFSDIEKQARAIKKQIIKIENICFDVMLNSPQTNVNYEAKELSLGRLQEHIQKEVEKQLLNRGIASKGYVKTEVALSNQSERKQIKKLFSEVDKLRLNFLEERKRL